MDDSFRKSLFVFIYLSSCVFFVASPAQASLITDIRFWSAPDHSRVVLDLTEPVEYDSSSTEDPPQLLLELKNAALYTRKREVTVNDPFIQKIILVPLEKDRVKLVLRQKKSLEVKIFSLKADLDKPHRLVIDLIDLVQEKKEQEDRKIQKETRTKGTRIVVIDPGHGGEDPGAIGPRRTMEKDIVLKVGKKLTQLLNENPEMKAFLTRKGDYFIPLEDRVKMAREYGADLFVSLHTDGSFNPQARGASVYCLSLSGATDEAARVLADKENMSDVLGGAVLKPASLSPDPNLNQILLDLLQNNSMKESIRFAELALQEVRKFNALRYLSFRQANFIVLRAPDISSALVEMAFISNREDERLLNQGSFQEKMASSLAATATRFFRDSP